jgi:hypothetical protein
MAQNHRRDAIPPLSLASRALDETAFLYAKQHSLVRSHNCLGQDTMYGASHRSSSMADSSRRGRGI